MNQRASKQLRLVALAAVLISTLTACAPVKDLVIRDGTREIRRYEYEGSTALETVVIPDSVTLIDDYAFKNCKNLKSIVIPDSVTEVGKWAFYGCESLSEVSLPVSAQYDESFLNNPNLTALTFTGDRFTEDYRHGWSFTDSLVHEGNGTNPTLYDTVEKITVADSITTIGKGAFYGFYNLKTVVLPDTVTAIESAAFAGCSSLETVDLPDSLTEIGEDAFSGCGLTAIEIPASVASIGDEAFWNCNGLTSITIPASVASIGNEAFKGCKNLTSVDIPPSVDSLGEDLFAGCVALRLAVRDIFPADFDSAEDVRSEQGRLIPEGARVVPMGEWQSEDFFVPHDPWGILDTSLYNQMPEDLRSADWFTADYAIMLDWEVHRDDSVTVITTNAYGTSVNSGSHVVYNVYLCGRDGTVRLIGTSSGKDGISVWQTISKHF